MADHLPGASAPLIRSEAWRHVEQTIRAVMHRHAFEEIRTPVLEPTALIARGVGEATDVVSKEMFSFERNDTSYVMRPELTAPVMRAYLQHHLGQQSGEQRLFYLGPCFRAERPQKGRYRQFHQFGTEIIGSSSSRADVETIAVMMAVYAEFGLKDMRLRINSLGSVESRPGYREALRRYFAPYTNQLSSASRDRLKRNPLRILDTKDPAERALMADAPRITDYLDEVCRRHFEEVKSHLTDLGIEFVEDHFLVRGLDYYTRTAFELEHSGIGAQRALAGGGRYDGLAEAVGARSAVAAVGFAAGTERLLLALGASGIELPTTPRIDVWVVAVGPAAERKVPAWLRQMRAAGLRASCSLTSRSLKAQLRLANRSGAKQVVIVGDRELEAGAVQVKDMDRRAQTTVPLEALVGHLDHQSD